MEAGKIFCAFAPSHGVRNGGWLGLLCAVKTGRTVMLTSWLTLNPAGACLTSCAASLSLQAGADVQPPGYISPYCHLPTTGRSLTSP